METRLQELIEFLEDNILPEDDPKTQEYIKYATEYPDYFASDLGLLMYTVAQKSATKEADDEYIASLLEELVPAYSAIHYVDPNILAKISADIATAEAIAQDPAVLQTIINTIIAHAGGYGAIFSMGEVLAEEIYKAVLQLNFPEKESISIVDYITRLYAIIAFEFGDIDTSIFLIGVHDALQEKYADTIINDDLIDKAIDEIKEHILDFYDQVADIMEASGMVNSDEVDISDIDYEDNA